MHPASSTDHSFIVKDYPTNITFDEDSLMVRHPSKLASFASSDSLGLVDSLHLPRRSGDERANNTSFLKNDGTNATDLELYESLLSESREHSIITSPDVEKTAIPSKCHTNLSSSSSPCTSSNSKNNTLSAAMENVSEGYTSVKTLQGHDSKSTKKSWDNWMLEKAVLDVKNVQRKKQRKLQALASKKLQDAELKRKILLAKQTRAEWLEQKKFQSSKKQKEISAQAEYEKLKERQRKQLISEKAQDKYNEWIQQKHIQDKRQKEKSKLEERNLEETKLKKRQQSEIAYKAWLAKADKKIRLNRSTQGYLNIYSMPQPSFINPLPWVAGENGKPDTTNCAKFPSPPLLWREVQARHQKKFHQKTKPMYSCVN